VRRLSVLVAGSIVAGMLAPAPADAAVPVTVPDSVDASGTRDVTDELNAFLQRLAPGSAVAFAPGGRYRVEGVVRLAGLRDVDLDGRGAVLFAETDGAAATPPLRRHRARWPRLREHLAIQDSDGVAVHDLRIEGPNRDGAYVPRLEGQAGIAVLGSTRVAIERVGVRAVHGDGVYVAGGSSDVTVRASTFERIGRQGVAVVDGGPVLIERNHLDRIGRSVIDVEPAVPRWSVTGVHVRENEIGDFRNFLLAAGGAGPDVSDLSLERNHVTGGNGIAVFAGMPRWLRRNIAIVANVSDVEGRHVPGSGRPGVIGIVAFDGVRIVGNRQRIAADTVAVTLTNSCNVEMAANDFPGGEAERRETGSCDEVPVQTPGPTRPRGPRARTPPASPSTPDDAGARAAEPPKRGRTDPAWIVAGALSGVVVLAALGALAWRRSRRSRA
jgi:hypothetical protein